MFDQGGHDLEALLRVVVGDDHRLTGRECVTSLRLCCGAEHQLANDAALPAHPGHDPHRLTVWRELRD